MSLKDELTSGPPQTKPLGKVEQWLQTLSDEDRDETLAAITDPQRWPIAPLRATLARHGLQVSPATLQRYRDDVLL